MKSVKISDSARTEYRDAVSWYGDRDARVAARFVEETRRMLDLIEQFPNLGSRVPWINDPAIRRMPIHNFPYHIVFFEVGNHVEVAAFVHKRRRPEYLVDRLRKHR